MPVEELRSSKSYILQMGPNRAGQLPADFLASVKRLREEGAQKRRLPPAGLAPSGKRRAPEQDGQKGEKKGATHARPGATARNLTARRTQSPSPSVDGQHGRDRNAHHDLAATAASSISVRTAPAQAQVVMNMGTKNSGSEKGCGRAGELGRCHPKAVPAANFYGSTASTTRGCDRPGERQRVARSQQLRSRLRAAVLHYRRTDIFREFRLQKEAVAYADLMMAENSEEVRVFARELDTTGKRKFFVTTYEECWRRLMRTERHHRHFYEVVREGWPCYLYFDIEFSKQRNPDTDGQRAMAAFLDFLPRGLRTLYPEHDIVIRPGDVIDLDSSTDVKFSRHLIVRPNAAQIVFHDNIHMGACVRQLVTLLHKEVKQGQRGLDDIYVRTAAKEPVVHDDMSLAQQLDASCASASCGGSLSNSGGAVGCFHAGTDECQPFIDMGVYTKNRCFRTFNSSKFGKKVVLVDAGGHGSTIEHHGNDEELYYRSLVCRLAHPRNLMTVLVDPAVPPNEKEGEGGVSKTRSVSCAMHRSGARQSDGGGNGGSGSCVVETHGTKGRWAEGAPVAGAEGKMWRTIGEYIIGIWNRRAGAHGTIRSASWLDGGVGVEGGGRVVSFKIQGNKWCDYVGRQHKSVSCTSPLQTPNRFE